ncbi:hypothetical protein V5N11_035278 [Cardamine amara subsp. amara]|uniref:CCHC-type domain-containing protein n=1 Tax=Cardamine amara subsp. amara TaxID=228776 RepID=A0ABD1BL26_CARAN
MQFWKKSDSVILPPPSLVESIENRKGRKPKTKRKKGKHESPQKKRVTREKGIMHCGKCGFARHNAKKCKNPGVEVYRPPKKKPTKTREDGYESNNTTHDGYESNNTTQGEGEGPSQPTQN